MEIMSDSEPVWEDHHHRSSFLPNANLVYFDLVSLISTNIVTNPQIPVLLQDTDSEGNLCHVTNTTQIDILVKPKTVEHVHVGQNWSTEETESYKDLFKEFRDIFAWTYEEMPKIDSSIVVHEIRTYPTAKPVRQNLCQVHPRKAAAIKA